MLVRAQYGPNTLASCPAPLPPAPFPQEESTIPSFLQVQACMAAYTVAAELLSAPGRSPLSGQVCTGGPCMLLTYYRTSMSHGCVTPRARRMTGRFSSLSVRLSVPSWRLAYRQPLLLLPLSCSAHSSARACSAHPRVVLRPCSRQAGAINNKKGPRTQLC